MKIKIKQFNAWIRELSILELPKATRRSVYIQCCSVDKSFKFFSYYKKRTNSLTMKKGNNVKSFIAFYIIILICFLSMVILTINYTKMYLIILCGLLLCSIVKLTNRYNLLRVRGYYLSKHYDMKVPLRSLSNLTPITIYKEKGSLVIGYFNANKRGKKRYIVRGEGVYVAICDFVDGREFSIDSNVKSLLHDVLNI